MNAHVRKTANKRILATDAAKADNNNNYSYYSEKTLFLQELQREKLYFFNREQ